MSFNTLSLLDPALHKVFQGFSPLKKLPLKMSLNSVCKMMSKYRILRRKKTLRPS